MAQCKMCGQKSLFLSVSENGLCKPCDSIVVMDIQQRGRIIQDCMRLINKSKNMKTRLSRCDLLIEHAQALLEYEHKGIPTVNPSPSQLLSEYTAIRTQMDREESIEKLQSNKGKKGEPAKGEGNRIQKAESIKREMATYNKVALERYKREGLEKVEWYTALDERTCEDCQALHGNIYPVGQAPELPYKGCTNLKGCRCTYLPVVE